MSRLRANFLRAPHAARLPSTHPRYREVLAAHAEAVAAGWPSYADPLSARQVFTAAFLAQRGTCCDSGCRHCPYVGAPGESPA